MKILTATTKPEEVMDKVLIMPVFDGFKPSKSDPRPLIKAMNNEEFKTEKFSMFSFFSEEKFKAERIVYISLGKESELSSETIKRAYAMVQRFLNVKKIKSFSVVVPKSKIRNDDFVQSILEGILLSNYQFDKYKSDSKDKSTKFDKLTLISPDAAKFKKAIQRSIILCSATNYTRDLVNENFKDKNSLMMVDYAKSLAKRHKLKLTVLSEKDLKKLGMGLILAVGQGSPFPPRMVIFEHRGNPKSKECTAIVGKGILYDTGGLDLKSADGMLLMKKDMAGGANVYGIMRAVADLKLPINVVGAVPLCENAISGNAYKPGDTFKSYSGKTVEIGNTDAEGRLVLADTLSYIIKKYNPKLTIDMATLTGACMVALGDQIAGIMGTDDKTISKLKEAGKEVGDFLHDLPLFEDYAELMKSQIADIRNVHTVRGSPGAITAGHFLKTFVNNKPWVHIDMAGPSFLSSEKRYFGPGATGFGVRAIVKLLES